MTRAPHALRDRVLVAAPQGDVAGEVHEPAHERDAEVRLLGDELEVVVELQVG